MKTVQRSWRMRQQRPGIPQQIVKRSPQRQGSRRRDDEDESVEEELIRGLVL